MSVTVRVVSVAVLPGCTKLFGAGDKDAGSAIVGPVDIAPSAACTMAGAPFAIDGSPRSDTGLTRETRKAERRRAVHRLARGHCAEGQERAEAITYDVPVSVEMPNHGGFVLASRDLGQLVVGKRAATLERSGDATRFNFGTPVGMAALVVTGSSVALFVSEAGKTDLLGTTFTAEAIPTTPEKIVLNDPKPPTDGDRASVSASVTDTGDLAVGFTDGKGASRRARVTLLGADLKAKVPVFDITNDENVSELRVGVLPDGRILAAYIETKDAKPVVTGAILAARTCSRLPVTR